jgi:hypothetical protein
VTHTDGSDSLIPALNKATQSDDRTGQGNCSSDEGSAMSRLNKQEFWEWAYGDLLTNTTRGVLAEYIVAKALGIRDTKRVEWDPYDLEIDGVKVEVKSAAYVQTWKQTQLSKIVFGIRPAKASAKRCADVYVFCVLEDREPVDPLDVEQWTFYVLSTNELNRKFPGQRTIRLGPLKDLGAHPCTYDELKAAIDAAAPKGMPPLAATTRDADPVPSSDETSSPGNGRTATVE